MLVPTILMGAVAIALLLTGYLRGQGQHVSGLKAALHMTVEMLPLLACALIVAGMIQVLVPQEVTTKFIGAESGLKGIFIGAVAGAMVPGGPFVSLPIALGFLRSGAGVGPMVAFLTSCSLWSLGRLPMEIGIMGWKLAFVRVASTFFFPPIAGLIAQFLFSGARWVSQ